MGPHAGGNGHLEAVELAWGWISCAGGVIEGGRWQGEGKGWGLDVGGRTHLHTGAAISGHLCCTKHLTWHARHRGAASWLIKSGNTATMISHGRQDG